MINVPEVTLSHLSTVSGPGAALCDLMLSAAKASVSTGISPCAVIAATFSNPVRFPSLAVTLASALQLPPETPAFDLQLACSAFPYAVYLAAKLSADLGGAVLVVDGDVQSPLVDVADPATGHIFSDAAAACLVTSSVSATSDRSVTFVSPFAFLSRHNTALVCDSAGPIRMDGFNVFSFVATEVSKFLRPFGTDFDFFAPHQANPYMIRQLAKTLGLERKLLVTEESLKNPGSCSVVWALKTAQHSGRALIAGFGAGYSAAAGIVRIAADDVCSSN